MYGSGCVPAHIGWNIQYTVCLYAHVFKGDSSSVVQSLYSRPERIFNDLERSTTLSCGRMIRLLARPSPPPPPPPTRSLSFSVFLCFAGRAYCREKGEGVGDEPKSHDSGKSWSSINHAIFSVHQSLLVGLLSLCILLRKNKKTGGRSQFFSPTSIAKKRQELTTDLWVALGVCKHY